MSVMFCMQATVCVHFEDAKVQNNVCVGYFGNNAPHCT